MSFFFNSLKNYFFKYSSLQNFFSKEIKEIDYGLCHQCLPCIHPEIKVTYEDESVRYFCDVSGYNMYDLCKKLNKELPIHFEYMENSFLVRNK